MLKTILHTPWDAMRWLRLGLGLVAGLEAIRMHDPFPGAIAFLLLYQALANTGCCGQMGCTMPVTKSTGSDLPVESMPDRETIEVKMLKTDPIKND